MRIIGFFSYEMQYYAVNLVSMHPFIHFCILLVVIFCFIS